MASLVDLGHVEAARQLAAAQGLPMLHREGRVLLVRARDSEKVVRVVESWSADVLAVAITRAESWYLLPSGHPRLADLRSVAIKEQTRRRRRSSPSSSDWRTSGPRGPGWGPVARTVSGRARA